MYLYLHRENVLGKTTIKQQEKLVDLLGSGRGVLGAAIG